MADDKTTGPAAEPNNSEHTDTPAGAPTGAPASHAEASQSSLNKDISSILKDIKLPERFEYAASGERLHPKPPQKSDLDTAIENKVTAPPVPEPPKAVPAPTTEDTTGSELPAIAGMHTLKQDLQHVVRDQKVSLVHAAALEQEKKRPQPIDFEPTAHSSFSTGVLFASLLLLFLGAAALFGVYTVMQQYAATPSVTSPLGTSLVFAEQTVVYPLGGKSPQVIKGELAQARTSGTLGSLRRIVPTTDTAADAPGQKNPVPATLSQFFSAIGANLPSELQRALGQEFFFGIHTVDENAPVLVIPVTSYDHAFAGMLQWESTMSADLSPIFTAMPHLTMGSDGIPTERKFVDDVMRNYDVRELKDDTGTVQLYYSFPTRNVLIIAESPYSFTEILSRLQAERRL